MCPMCLYPFPTDPGHGQAQGCVQGRSTVGNGMMATDFEYVEHITKKTPLPTLHTIKGPLAVKGKTMWPLLVIFEPKEMEP